MCSNTRTHPAGRFSPRLTGRGWRWRPVQLLLSTVLYRPGGGPGPGGGRAAGPADPPPARDQHPGLRDRSPGQTAEGQSYHSSVVSWHLETTLHCRCRGLGQTTWPAMTGSCPRRARASCAGPPAAGRLLPNCCFKDDQNKYFGKLEFYRGYQS